MSLEQFKTQVLLLHSEQSTLDNLSSGFNDRYTVHCATSGSEALNTLGEIQIDVIVSAQELPGMSGLEALREAKKRSPDTIGILLAGASDQGLEALVGDQEVFEIVRGNVTPDSLKNLIDNATRQARLIALAESANDTTASPDSPVTEHIVMETSENGSTIISDGTGQVPTLNPAKISAAADVGANAVDVLVLTQDEEFLGTIKESARGLHNVIYSNTVSQADEAIKNHKIGVAVVDAALVGNNVEKLTMHLRASSPRLVAIVAGRRDDGEMLMDLINRGKVYRFLLKPVSPGRARLAVEASVKHHLEAPDAAFKMAGQPAAAPKPAAKPASKPAPKPAPEAKAAPKPEKSKPAEKPAPKARPETGKPPQEKAARPEKNKAPAPAIVPKRDEALSPMDDGLSDAFGGEDESSFTQTMTGLVETVTKSLKPKQKTDDTPVPQADAGDPGLDIDPLAAGSGGSLFSDPKILGAGAVAIVAVAAVGYWLYSGDTDDAPVAEPVDSRPIAEQTQPQVEQPSFFDTEVVVPEVVGLDDLIDEAQLAANAGNLFSPAGDNAIELYLEALALAPDDPVAADGLQAAIEQAISMAETALLERRPDDASAAMQGVELADPDNARLPFLRAQLTQMQLRDYIDNARAAIRDGRFEDAQRSIGGARALDVANTADIDAVMDELRAALNNQQVEEVLAQANARLDAGNLIAPSNDNARYYFELALSQDPDNVAAQQGLVVIASKLALQARAEIDAGNFDDADNLLDSARGIDPSSSELAAATDALAAARERREQEIRAAAERAAAERAAAQRAAAERAAAERAAAERAAAERAAAERAAAERAAAERAAAEREAAQRAAAERAAAERLSVESAAQQAPAQSGPQPVQQAAEQPAQQTPRRPVQQAAERPAAQTPAPVPQQQAALRGPDVAVAGAGDTVESGSLTPPQADAAPLADPVAVNTLKRTRYVAPKYPRAAQRRGISGWVDVVFTVDYDGTVRDVSVRDSNPGETFVSAATTAVERWEFEPVIEDGVAVQKRAAVRMMFAIE